MSLFKSLHLHFNTKIVFFTDVAAKDSKADAEGPVC